MFFFIGILREFCHSKLRSFSGCGDTEAVTDECMHDSLRSSKSLLVFSSEMGRSVFNKSIVAALCQSGKLQSVLDSPDEYNLIFVDVVEKGAGERGCGREAIEAWATDMEAMEKEREERAQGIKEAFKAQVEDAIFTRSLWPHLGETNMTESIGRTQQDFYRSKIPSVTERLKYFDVYPVTFCGLRNINSRQTHELLLDDSVNSDLFNLMDLTSVPKLIDTFREILIEGSVSVRRTLTTRLQTIIEDLSAIEAVIDSGQSDQIKERLKGILNDTRKRKRPWSTLMFEDLKQLSTSLQSIVHNFEADLRLKLPKVDEQRFSELRSKYTSSKKAPRAKSLANLINCAKKRTKGSVDLLVFLFGDVLDQSAFKSNLQDSFVRMRDLCDRFLEKARLHLTNAFEDALMEQIFSGTVKAKSSLTFDAIEKVFNFSLNKYEETLLQRSENMLQILHLSSQRHIFSNLTPEQKASEDSLATAILRNSQEAIDQGLKSIVSEPADGMFKCQGLLFNGSFKCLEQHLQKLVENCEKSFEKTLKSFSKLDCGIKGIITPLRLDLDQINIRLCRHRHETYTPKWDPIRQVTTASAHDDTLHQGDLTIVTSFSTRPAASQIYRPRVRVSADNFDPQGLYKSLTYAK